MTAFAAALVLAQVPTPVANPKAWTMVAGGDVMLYHVSPKRPSFSKVASLFRKADVAYLNLEIPLTNATEPTPFKSAAEIRAKQQFVLKADPVHIKQLKALGIDLFSLANNHAMDYGKPGLQEMIGLLDKARLAYSGAGMNLAEAEKPAIYTLKNGMKVAMVSYLAFMGSGAMAKCGPARENSPGIATLEFDGVVGPKAKQRMKRLVGLAKKQADLVFVALHWGIERQSKPTPYQISLGRTFIDCGADAILGAHPHTLQGKEVYRGKPIVYSMGNFISPLPAKSAIYTLRYNGKEFQGFQVTPMRNVAGRCELYSKQEAPARLREIEALDRLIPKPLKKAK